MASKKKTIEELPGCGGEGSVITRTVKPKAKNGIQEPYEGAEVCEAELHCCGAIAFTSEFVERLVLLFDLPCVIAFCKCALVWSYADGNDEMADLLAKKYVELCKRLEAQQKGAKDCDN